MLHHTRPSLAPSDLLSLLLVTLLAPSLLFAAPTQSGSPSSASPALYGPIDLQKVVRLAELLEAQPFAPQAKDIRSALTTYIIDAPDLTVILHGDMLGDPEKLHPDYGPLLVAQMMFGMASYSINHPRAKPDDLAVQLAGVESALRLYSTLKRLRQDASMQQLESLVALRSINKLSQHVTERLSRDSKAPGQAK
ncbi:MAG: hypothetical protein HY815_21080 [Candidatus Riflebacteria bacterium]|nr:hypothetical protein [Candidatus Riflebacteria bacterium]